MPSYNHHNSIQKGDDHDDECNFDAHNVTQGNDRPEVILLLSVRASVHCVQRHFLHPNRKTKGTESMTNITLKKIDESNFIDCFNLKLAEGQDQFVSHPIRSLAQAYVYYHQCTPFGIYAGDIMVGYVMVIYDSDTWEYNLWHLMIDRAHQRQGYGKQAVLVCLDYIQQKPFGPGTSVLLTCHEENTIAVSLYKSLGFQETGNRDEEEIEMKLTL